MATQGVHKYVSTTEGFKQTIKKEQRDVKEQIDRNAVQNNMSGTFLNMNKSNEARRFNESKRPNTQGGNLISVFDRRKK